MADYPDILFEDNSGNQGTVTDHPSQESASERDPYPKPVISLSEPVEKELTIWVDQYLEHCISAHEAKIVQWTEEEEAYRKTQDPQKTEPYVGACNDVIPVIAMSVDPVHARLDTGIFKSDPVFQLKGIRKGILPFVPALMQFVEYYQKHKLELRRVCLPAILELVKHGTMVLKTVYDHERYDIQSYDKDWNVVKKTITRFKGPRVFHVPLQNFMFLPRYSSIQKNPFVVERIWMTPDQLRIAEASGKLANVDKVVDYVSSGARTQLDQAREESANHKDTRLNPNDIELFEIHCDYDLNGDKLPESLVLIYHRDSQTFLQRRYNWYFHQRKPYTVIPYMVANDTPYGLGMCEMALVFQNAETKWHQMATDNAYIANMRMFVAKKGSGIEHKPKLFAGKVFEVDDPKNDLTQLQLGDIYNSTLQERQNIFGLAEKRTGISDYLTGRESPIVGSRATATSTMALIQEGTRRVEEVLENIRNGLAEVLENCFYLWIQYGTDDIEDIVFSGDDVAEQIKKFFSMNTELNMAGALSIDLSATDAASNRSVQQQVQLAIVQTMIQYYTQLVQLGQLAVQSSQTMPQLTMLLGDIAKSARQMFRELLIKYDIRNPDEYLPDLEKYLNAASPTGSPMGEGSDGAGGVGVPPGLSGITGEGFIPPSAIPQPSNQFSGQPGSFPIPG